VGNAGTSVLASLTSQVMGEKVAAAPRPKLTPVQGEKPVFVATGAAGLPKSPQAPFPNDVPQEVLQEKLRDLDRIIKHLGEARDALALVANEPLAADPVTPEAKQKAKERAADEQFAERMARQQEEAQAATFDRAEALERGGAAPSVVEAERAANGWTCPTHKKAVTKVSPSSGREYLGCPDCKLFAR